jgi:hypothetical protein
MKEIDTEKKRQRSEAQLLLGWLKMLPQSELEALSRRKVGACAIGRRVDACIGRVADV